MKTVLVTGGASGIGRAFVERLSQQGWRVCAMDMNAAALQELASDTVSTYVCDVADLEQVKAVIGQILEDFDCVDRLIHCAAIMPAGKLATMAAEARPMNRPCSTTPGILARPWANPSGSSILPNEASSI